MTLQETKLQVIDLGTFREICGKRLDQFVEVPAQGTRGGLFIAWRKNTYTMVQADTKQYLISIILKHNYDASTMVFTAVYGPTAQSLRAAFYNELREAKPLGSTPWAIGGDFNVSRTG